MSDPKPCQDLSAAGTRTIRVGSLCTGVAGLDYGYHHATGGRTVNQWYAEVDPDAATVLKTRLPGVANIGDITTVDWAALPPIDALLAGFPCQPVSAAGRQQATDDKRWLWPHVRAAYQALQPQEINLENVRNLVSIQGGRIFAAILQDLRDDGYAVRWATMGACAVGGCHHRHRVFIVARYAWQLQAPAAVRVPLAECGARRGKARAMLPTPTAARYGYNQGGASSGGPIRHGLDAVHQMLPTPTASDGMGGPGGNRGGGDNLRTAAARLGDESLAADAEAATDGKLLPTPRATDTGTPGRAASPGWRPPLSQVIAANDAMLLPTPRARDSKGGEPPHVIEARHAAGSFHGGDTLPSVIQYHLGEQAAMLPTPRASDAAKGSPNQHGGRGIHDLMLPSAVIGERYGRYAGSVGLWEARTGMPAPEPTILNAKGQWRLNPALPEWMQGFTPGWITELVGRSAALRLAGNSVVWQVAAAAYPLITAGWDLLAAGDLSPADLGGRAAHDTARTRATTPTTVPVYDQPALLPG